MKILNGQEAFAALSAGQKIEARHQQATEFDSLDNFPATILVNPEYEFRIALTFITIGEMQVPEPVKEAPAKGAQYFAPSLLTEELSKSFKWKNSDLDLALLQRGQVHLEQEHAVIHAQALIAISGGSADAATETQADNQNDEQQIAPVDIPNINESDLTDHPQIVTVYGSDVRPDGVYDNFKSCVVNTTSTETIQHFIYLIQIDPILSTEQIKELIEFAESRMKGLIDQSKCEAIETDPVKIVEKFTTRISQFTKVDDVLSFRHVFMANGHLDQKDQQHLCKLCEEKVLELDPEQYTPQPEPVVDEVSQASLIDEIDQQATKVVQDKIYKDAMSGNGQASYPIDLLTKKKKEVLINRIYAMETIEELERLAPAIPAAKLNPEDHQELLRIYAERKTAMQHADA